MNNLNTEVVGECNPSCQETPQDQLQSILLFPSMVYVVDKPEFLEDAKETADWYLKKSPRQAERDEIYPIIQTDTMQEDPRIRGLTEYILNTSWNILESQGYMMDNLITVMHAMWCQDHGQTSGQEKHVHGMTSQLSGFYFLEVPNESSVATFHDPRPAKEYADLPEKSIQNVTYASRAYHLLPKPGLLVFSNSWLPHSFERNRSKENFKFLHFNVGVSSVMLPPNRK